MSYYKSPTSGETSKITFFFTHEKKNSVIRFLGKDKCSKPQIVAEYLTNKPHSIEVARGEPITLSVSSVLRSYNQGATLNIKEVCNRVFTINPRENHYVVELIANEKTCSFKGYTMDKPNQYIPADSQFIINQCE